MPLSSDPQILETSNGLVNTLKGAFQTPPGFRPAHARGHLLTGTFTPTSSASTLSKAPHFNLPSTPITARFSSSTGIPKIPDTDPNANPRGIAIRFHLPNTPDGKRAHTDIIAHSTKYFPTRTGADFLAFLQTLGQGGEAVGKWFESHPETKRFVDDPKPSPVSFATQKYFGVNAFKFVDKSGKGTFVRYRFLPVAGFHTLSEEETKANGESYLFEELGKRIGGGNVVEFKLVVQVAGDGDATDDATVIWPDEREILELGTVRLDKVVETDESLKEEKKVIFDPIPRVEGVEASSDPLLDVRANVYLISGKERRQA